MNDTLAERRRNERPKIVFTFESDADRLAFFTEAITPMIDRHLDDSDEVTPWRHVRHWGLGGEQ